MNLLVLLTGMTHAAHATPCGVLSIAVGKSTIDVSEPCVLYIGTGYIPTTIVGIPPPKPPLLYTVVIDGEQTFSASQPRVKETGETFAIALRGLIATGRKNIKVRMANPLPPPIAAPNCDSSEAAIAMTTIDVIAAPASSSLSITVYTGLW